MTAQNFALLNHTAGMGTEPYIRIFNSAGDVLDFADNTFKATLAAATTPYKKSVEMVEMGGATKSSYIVTVDPADFWNREGGWFFVLWFANTVPANTDEAIAPVADGPAVAPELAQWFEWGEMGKGEILVQCEMNVKSTSGVAAQLAIWLERNGKKLDIDAADAAVTGSAVVREHEAGSPLFTTSYTITDVVGDRLEKTQATPGFTDDRSYEIDASIVINGVTYETTHSRVVFG